MSTIQTIIIDDEAMSLQLLKNMLQEHCPQIQIIAEETDIKKGIAAIKETEPQLVFLDIEMLHMNAFEALKKLEPLNFEVIFVTAYSRYALDAFDVQACGFITKPVNAEKLMTAVKNASRRIEEKSINRYLFSLLEAEASSQKIPLATQNGWQFVKIDEITYCESSGNYTHFYLKNREKVVVSRQIGEYEKLLPEHKFVRIHDKYIIQLSFIRECRKETAVR
ncbi:MAG: LytTR family DNA-binding domain-containing protein [Chitinophagaceae bacterium]|nr:LytTR family DNA-binding domain-containing protein [Chitinophagaceae bacterium]